MLGIYCRTSKSRKEKHTIENQREAGISCAQKLGLGFRVYVDDGISGTLDESIREGLADLFRDIKKKEITHVYCIDQSRIERDSRTWDFFVADTRQLEIEETDLLFIDTWHDYLQLKKELFRHSNKVKKYIILHDTVFYGFINENLYEDVLIKVGEFFDAL